MINNNRLPDEDITDTVQITTFLNYKNEKYSNYKAAFNYSNLNRCVGKKLFLKYLDKFEAYNIRYLTGQHFIHLACKTEGRYENTQNERGFKFHISLDHNNGNVGKAWSIIINHLINHEVFLSKIISNAALHLMAASREQCGKEITIYAYLENRPSQAWQSLIEDITHDFVNNQIKPGPLPPSDTEIKGSNYFSYRDDHFREDSTKRLGETQQDLFSEFQHVKEDSHSNSSDNSSSIIIIDPFAQIEIKMPNQLSRAEFKKDIILPNIIPKTQHQKNVTDEKSSTDSNKNKDDLNKKNISKVNVSNDRFINSHSMFPPQNLENNTVANPETKEEPLSRNRLKKYCHCVIQ
jgi:hypothetical protein